MDRLIFEQQSPVIASDPNRSDIACFVGFVARRDLVLPTEVEEWLRQQGWMSPPYGRPSIEELLDVPVPIDTWETFDRLFAWEKRPSGGDGGASGGTYLGAAVRSFFTQGGRKCYVVRVGEPWPLTTGRDQRLGYLSDLLPGFPGALTSVAADRHSWTSVGHLFGLPDVSFLSLPDLADIVGDERTEVDAPIIAPQPEEQFVECSASETAMADDEVATLYTAPRCDEKGYRDWALAVSLVADFVRRYQREVQLVAAVPLPRVGAVAERDLLEQLIDGGFGSLASPLTPNSGGGTSGLSSSFLQLAYPWVRTSGSANLPEQLESPDGVLVGVLSRNALMRGAFRSAAGLHLADVRDLFPSLRHDQMARPHRENPLSDAQGHNLAERVSLLGQTPAGLRLLSDVTTSLDDSYRPACVNRLVSIIARAARRLGEDIIFDSSGERLWAHLRVSLNSLLLGLLQAGALRGATPEEAFYVRCDRSTMSQNDIDNGRAIAQVQFNAAAPIDRISVVLALGEGGQLLMSSGPRNGALL